LVFGSTLHISYKILHIEVSHILLLNMKNLVQWSYLFIYRKTYNTAWNTVNNKQMSTKCKNSLDLGMLQEKH